MRSLHAMMLHYSPLYRHHTTDPLIHPSILFPKQSLPSTSGFTASYTEYARLEVARDLKESVCRMPDAGYSESKFVGGWKWG